MRWSSVIIRTFLTGLGAMAALAAAFWPVGGPVALADGCGSTHGSITITANTSWTTGESPVCITGQVLVADGVTLTVEPGVVVKFQDSGSYLQIHGTLSAKGTSGNKIYFTSLKDDTVGGDANLDGGATSPSQGDWWGLYLYGSPYDGIGDLDWTEIRYGGAGGSGSLYAVYSQALTLTNSIVSQSSIFGAMVQGVASGNAVITSTQFLNNASHGLYVHSSHGATVNGNTFTNNGGYAAYIAGSNLPATYAGNSGSGNGINGLVFYNDTVVTNTLWPSAPNFPYVLASQLPVNDGTTLTLQPGVVVKSVDSSSYPMIYGTLTAKGTSSNKIYFTSLKDDTVGGDTNHDAGATSPSQGDWWGIYLYGPPYHGIGDLDWTEIRYGGAGGNGSLYAVYSQALTLTNSIVSQSSIFGAMVQGVASGNAVITSTQFLNNASHGLYVHSSHGATVNGNTFTNNGGYAAYIAGSNLPATYAGNSGSGNGINGLVFYDDTVVTNTLWPSASNFPYVLASQLPVNDGTTLTLQPGVVVKSVDSSSYPMINGALSAKGTSSNKIYFTSLKDDTVGGDTNHDAGATSPSQGDWWGIYLYGPPYHGIGDLDWTEIRYGGAGGNGSLYAVYSQALTLTNSVVRESGSPGATISSATGPVIVANSLFTGNSGWGLQVFNSAIRLHSSDVVSNTAGGVYLSNAGASVVRNTLVISNTSSGVGLSGAAPTFENNDVFGNGANYAGWGDQTGSSGNISADPMFVNFGGGDYHLKAGSPALNTGTALGAPSKDIDGDNRPEGPGYDMGFDERTGQAPPTAVGLASFTASPGLPQPWVLLALGGVLAGAFGAARWRRRTGIKGTSARPQ